MIGNVVVTKHFRAAPASFDAIPHIAANLREGDRLEIERFYNKPPENVLHDSLEQSIMSWMAWDANGVPVALWGASKFRNPDDGVLYGVPWLLGTDAIGESYGDFLRLSRHFDTIMSRWFFGLANAVDAEYDGALRWLEWLGFQRGDTITTPGGHDFILMYKDTRDVR